MKKFLVLLMFVTAQVTFADQPLPPSDAIPSRTQSVSYILPNEAKIVAVESIPSNTCPPNAICTVPYMQPRTKVTLQLELGGCNDHLGPVTFAKQERDDGRVDLLVAALKYQLKPVKDLACIQIVKASKHELILQGTYTKSQLGLKMLASDQIESRVSGKTYRRMAPAPSVELVGAEQRTRRCGPMIGSRCLPPSTLLTLAVKKSVCNASLLPLAVSTLPQLDGTSVLAVSATEYKRDSARARCRPNSQTEEVEIEIPGRFDLDDISDVLQLKDSDQVELFYPLPPPVDTVDRNALSSDIVAVNYLTSAKIVDVQQQKGFHPCPAGQVCAAVVRPDVTNVTLEFNFPGCFDQLGPVSHSVSAEANGNATVHVSALRLVHKDNLRALCARMITARHTMTLLGLYDKEQLLLSFMDGETYSLPSKHEFDRIETIAYVSIDSVEQLTITNRPGPVVQPGTRVKLSIMKNCGYQLLPPAYTVADGQSSNSKVINISVTAVDNSKQSPRCMPVPEKVSIDLVGRYTKEEISLNVLGYQDLLQF